jgi:hypothetical protein
MPKNLHLKGHCLLLPAVTLASPSAKKTFDRFTNLVIDCRPELILKLYNNVSVS